MIQSFKGFPESLQKQILIRVGCGAIFFLLDIVSLAVIKDINTFVIGIMVTLFCFGQAVWLFYVTGSNKYVVISGICCDISITPIKQRVKSLIVRTTAKDTESLLRVMVHGSLKRVPPGTKIDIYVSLNTPMYERDGAQQLGGYLAIDLKGGSL